MTIHKIHENTQNYFFQKKNMNKRGVLDQGRVNPILTLLFKEQKKRGHIYIYIYTKI